MKGGTEFHQMFFSTFIEVLYGFLLYSVIMLNDTAYFFRSQINLSLLAQTLLVSPLLDIVKFDMLNFYFICVYS